MILLEDTGVKEDSVSKVVKYLNGADYNKEFDETIDGINFYYTKDQDKVVFIQKDSAYATITKNDIDNEKEEDIIESIKYQLDNTYDDDEE